MAEEKICKVCEKHVAVDECEMCKADLCEKCLRKIKMQSGNPAEQTLNIGISGGASISTLRAGIITRKVCEKCMFDMDVE